MLYDLRYKWKRFDLSDYELFIITGSDRDLFLQGQTSNNIKRLSFHRSQLSARLNRQGRVQGFFYVAKKENAFFLLIPSVISNKIVADLKTFIISEDVDIKGPESSVRGLMGPSLSVKELSGQDYFHFTYQGEDSIAYWGKNWNAFDDRDEICKNDLETLRILNGWPRWGLNVVPDALVNETPLDRLAVSYDKGCFLGQETAAKIHARRGAARGLSLLEVENNLCDFTGCSFFIEKKKAGKVFSQCSFQGRFFMEVQLGRLFRVPGREFILQFDDHRIKATVHEYPFFKDDTSAKKAVSLYDHALFLFRQNREKESESVLNHCLKINPDFADAHEFLGVLHGRNKRYDKAIACMDKLLELKPNSIMAHANKSLYYMNLGRIEEAEEEKKLATVNEFLRKGAEFKAQKAQELEKKAREKQMEQREKMFMDVLKIDPDDTTALYGLGEMALQREHFDQAVIRLERVLQIDEAHYSTYLSLGKAFTCLNKKKSAVSLYQKGIDLASKQGEVKACSRMQQALNELNSVDNSLSC